MTANFEKLGDVAARVVGKLSVPALGLHDDISASRYHADDVFDEPTLSSSIANILIEQTPRHAWLAHPRLGGSVERKASREMDLGSVAHEILLGKGGGFVVSPYDEFRSKEAKAWRDGIVEEGKTPIKEKYFLVAEQISESVRRVLQEINGDGMETAFKRGKSEIVILWRDTGGPLCRAMMDYWYPPIVWDLKTTGNGLSDRALRTWIASGLDLQAAFYLRGVETALPALSGRVKFRWVFVETEAPFEARVVEVDAVTRAFGDHKAALAVEKWRRCLATDDWSGYPREIQRLEYPAWAETNVLAREAEDPDALAMRPMFAPMMPTKSDQSKEWGP
jgi:hypothetical protein